MEQFAHRAMEKVREYRKCEDFEAVREMLREQVRSKGMDCFCWEMYELAMLNFLFGDFQEGQRMLSLTMKALDQNYVWGRHTVPWLAEVYAHCAEVCLPQCGTREAAQKMVADMIDQRRTYFTGKTSFKNMKGTYVAPVLK